MNTLVAFRRRARRLLFFTLAALAMAGPSARAQDAAALLAQSKQAAGGSAWDGVRSLHVQYRTAAGGLAGTRGECDDVRAGRFATTYTRPQTSGGGGFDGVSPWTQFSGGYSYVLGDEDARLGAANQSYQTCRAFWFPERHPATLAHAGARQEGERTLDVVAVTPQGGRPFEIWIDRATHLIDRVVEQQAEDVQITRFSDYRMVDGVRLPFTVRTGDGDPKWDEVDTLESVRVNVPLAPDGFALPPDPAPDFRFTGGKTSTTVPFRLEDNKIILPVRINGEGPFEAELDSGGNYILQPALATRLRLKAMGASQNGGGGAGFVAAGHTTVRTLDIGGVRLANQVYKVLPFSGAAPERTLLGLQIFKRFVVRLDFDRQTLTLTRPQGFAYRGGGTAVPFHFQSNQPEVNGAVDGIAGTFCIDTGDNGSLLLIAPFVRRYGLAGRYAATLPYGGTAVGGATHGLMTRAGRLTLSGADGRPAVSASGPLTRLSTQAGGFDADLYVSGNVGVGVLKQFNLVFDYSRQRIIFEKNRGYGRKDVFNRVGLRLKQAGPRWQVVAVFPQSPAAEAQIREGDAVLTINGRDPVHLGDARRAALWTGAAGSRLSLLLQSGRGRRTVTLTLRDLL